MPEKLELIVESFNSTRNQQMLSKQSHWATVYYGEKEFSTSYGNENCEFNSNHFELGSGKDADHIIVKLWALVNDVKIVQGECLITMDQLKLGEGIREEYDMLKDAQLVGQITIESKYFSTPKIVAPEEEEAENKEQGFSIAVTNNFEPVMKKPTLGAMPMMGSPRLSTMPKLQSPFMMGGMGTPMGGQITFTASNPASYS